MKKSIIIRKLLLKNNVILTVSLIFFIAIICLTAYYIHIIVPYIGTGDGWDARTTILTKTQSYSEFIFIYFMFIAHASVFDMKRRGMEEVLKTTKYGIINIYKDTISAFIILDIIITSVFLLINIIFAYLFEIATFEVIIHIIINQFLNYFLTSLLAICIGFFTGSINKRVTGYFFFIAITIFTSPIVTKSIPNTVLMATEKNIFTLTQCFDIFPPNLTSFFPFGFGLSVLPYRFALIIFWLSLFILLYSLKSKYIQINYTNQRNLIMAVTSTITALSLLLFLLPSSRVIRNFDKNQSMHDQYYYNDPDKEVDEIIQNQELLDEEFQVEKYEIKFTVLNQLYAEVIITLSDSPCNIYNFTLYHGYKVNKITDDNGRKLTFNRPDDYIAVMPDYPTKTITIKYHGSSPQYYSNLQGLSLPAGFAFYPIPGIHRVYDTTNCIFFDIFTEDNTQFDVTVKSNKKVYCNFDETEKNHFEGKSNALTLISGFYKEYCVDGFTFIYPYLSGDITKARLEEYAQSILALPYGKELAGNKKIFATPNINIPSHCTYASDHVVSHASIWNIDEFTIEKYLRENKK